MKIKQVIIFMLLSAYWFNGSAVALPAEKTMASSVGTDKRNAESVKRKLFIEKKVASWPKQLGAGGTTTGSIAVPLTVYECVALGGNVKIWDGCGSTHLKCVSSSGHEICIDEKTVN